MLRSPRRTAVVAGIASSLAALASLLATPAIAQPAGPAPSGRSKLAIERRVHATDRIAAPKSRTSRLATSSAALLRRTDARPVAVVVKYDYDSIATYRGEPGGARATAPAATGRPLTPAVARSSTYAQVVARREAAITTSIRKAVPSARIGRSLRVVYGGVAMVIPANQAKALLDVRGVVAVQEDAVGHKLTDSSPDFVDAPPVWDTLGSQATAGAGVLFADLDSGVWPEHPSFAANPDLPARPKRADDSELGCAFGDNPLTPETDVFECNNKLVAGYAFLDTYNLVSPDPEHFGDTARDSDGHGTHTTSTAAGDVVEHANPLGVDRGTISGLAPGAQVAEYKVCGANGCYSSDSAAAVAQAVLDGAKVINFSISGGTDPFSDPAELAFLDAYDAGVFVAASAGNEGPDASTANHLSPWVATVAASTQRRAFESTLTLTGGDGATATFTGASITAGVTDPNHQVVFASDSPYGDARCQTDPTTDPDIPDDVFAGKIVACQRGTNARIEKGYNVKQGGAVGMVLYNPTLADTETDNHWLPAIHLADGTDFVKFLVDHAPVTGTFTPGTKVDGTGDVMAAFSSRGPAGPFIKPDVTAPGVQILAGQTPVLDAVDLGPEGEYFQAIAGTSMSGPHVAGAGILLAAAHPDWTPGEIKSALMTTATTAVLKEDEATPADPFDLGAGRIDIAAAADAGLVLDETGARFTALTAGQDAIDLNIASVNAPVMPGRVSTTRTFTNVGAGSATYHVATTAPAGSTITASPSTFTVPAGATATVTITITSSRTDGVQQFGQVNLSAAGRRPLHLPVAWVPTQGDISATSSCDDTTLDYGATAHCDVTVQNDSFADTTASIHSSVDSHLEVTGATGSTSDPLAGVSASTVDATDVPLAGRQLGVPSLEAQDGFGGFVELADGSTTPDAIGDEEFLTYAGLGSITYNGQSYDQVNVNSNGYLVLGPVTSADDVCCPPQGSPDAAPPNNVIAPFWSDLAGDTGTPAGEEPLGVYGALFSDDSTGATYLVLESRLTDCCEGDDVHGSTKVSEVWFRLDGPQEISIDYPADAKPDTSGIEQAPGDPLATVVVQNEAGDGDQYDLADPLPSDFFVVSTDPIPGDSYTLGIDVKGVKAGGAALTSEVTSPGVRGTTVVKTGITVGPAPLTGVDAFITRAFQDFLGRNPSGAELASYRKKLDDGTLTRRAFVKGLVVSDEYLGHEVDQRFAQILGRAADPSGRAYWIKKLRTGLSENALVANIAGSNEFWNKAGATADGFADRLYQVLVDRTATAGERSQVSAWLAGGMRRPSVASVVYASSESGRHRVTDLYLYFLHRQPDPSGLGYWSKQVVNKGDLVLALELASSNEYYHRTR